jgi:Ca-activated chloride channel family protein
MNADRTDTIPSIPGNSFGARTDRGLVRAAGGSERFVLVELVAPSTRPGTSPGRQRPPANLCFVLDRSGSMGGWNKFDLARKGVIEGLHRLERTDRFSVVVYDNQIDVIVPSTHATTDAIQAAERALAAVGPRDATNLGEGWLRGAEQVASGLLPEGVNRVLLLTDGLANVGITDPAELAHHAAALRARGVTTSTIGVGTDFDEALLQGMTDAGGGHFYFAGSVPEIFDHLTSEVGEALDVTVREAILEVVAPSGVQLRTLTPQPIEWHGERWAVRIGDLVADQHARVVLRMTMPSGAHGTELGLLLSVGDRDGALAGTPTLGLQYRFVSDAESYAQPRDVVVDRAVAGLFAARARQEAVRLNRMGDWDGACHALVSVANRIARYAGADPELLALASRLREVDAPQMAAPMPELNRKQAHFAASAASRGRDEKGKSMKRTDLWYGPSA